MNTEEIVGEPPPITPKQKLEDLIRLAELCVDLLRQNEEFYAEVLFRLSASFSRATFNFKINQAAITSVLFPLSLKNYSYKNVAD